MRFSISKNYHQQFAAITLFDNQTNVKAEVFCFGGLLNEFSILLSNSRINIIDGYTDINAAINEKNAWFKSCKLSPFVCRLNNGKYRFNDVNYTIEKFYLSNHAIHGLVYDAAYDLVKEDVTENYASIELQHLYKATDNGYPFSYFVKLIYTLMDDGKLSIKSVISHHNNIAIPYCEGWHPYFRLDEPVDNCYLKFGKAEHLQFDNELIPTGKTILDNSFTDFKKLEGLELDDCYKALSTQNECVLKSKNLSLTITPVQSYPYLQIFIPDHRKNIAIENLSAAPDAFNNKMGLTMLDPNKEYVFETMYQLSQNEN